MGWGDGRQSESDLSPTPSSPPQPLPPTRVYPQDSGTSNLSTSPLSGLGSFQRLALTPSSPPKRQRPVLTPLERAASPRSDLPRRHPEPSRTVLISSSYQSQHSTPTSSVYPQSNRHHGRERSEKVPNKPQAHPSSQGLPALPPTHQRVVRPTSSAPPVPRQLPSLDPRLAAITPKDSKLTPDRKCCPETFYISAQFRCRI